MSHVGATVTFTFLFSDAVAALRAPGQYRPQGWASARPPPGQRARCRSTLSRHWRPLASGAARVPRAGSLCSVRSRLPGTVDRRFLETCGVSEPCWPGHSYFGRSGSLACAGPCFPPFQTKHPFFPCFLQGVDLEGGERLIRLGTGGCSPTDLALWPGAKHLTPGRPSPHVLDGHFGSVHSA